MDMIFDSLSTRELAWVFWLMIAFIACMFNKNIRQSILTCFKSLFVWKISVSLLIFFAHTALWVFILFKIGLWDISLFKDTIIWTLGFGFVSLVNINKVNDSLYFKKVFFDAIKWTIAIEFIVNFFTFSLTMEMIILPFLAFSAVMQAFASLKTENKQVENLFKYILNGFGLLVFSFSLYKTIEQHSQLFEVNNLKSFLLPVFLSITFLPFMYLYNLFVKYEELWIILYLNIRNNKDRRRVKRQILWIANFSIDKLVSILNNIAKPLNGYNDHSYKMIKTISKGKYIGFDEKHNDR